MAGKKLPSINYNAGSVQSLGRADVNRDNRTQAAKLGMYQSGLNLARTVQDVMQQNDMNEAVSVSSELTEEMSELNTKISSKKMWTPDELDDMGVDYEATETVFNKDTGNDEEQFRKSIPAYEVAEEIYKTQSAAIKKAAMSKVSGKGMQVVENNYASLYKQGIDDALKHKIRYVYEAQAIKMSFAYERAVARGSMQGARDILDQGKESGVWNADEYVAKMMEMPQRVMESKYMIALNETNDAQTLERYKSEILANPLIEKSRTMLYKQFDAKIESINKKTEKTLKEEKEMKSAVEVSRIANSLAVLQTPYSPSQLDTITAGMTPTDIKIVGKLNASLHNKTNPDKMRRLTAAVQALSLPGDKDVFTRRKYVVDELMVALDNKQISVTDFMTLSDRVNKAQDFQYKNPDVIAVTELMWKQFTGGSREMISNVMVESGISISSAIKAEFALREAVRTSDAGFNPYDWWDKNKTGYFTDAVRSNIQDLEKQISKGNVVVKPGTNHEIDHEKTMENLKNKEASGEMNRKEINAAIKEMNETSTALQRLFGADPKLKEQFSK